MSFSSPPSQGKSDPTSSHANDAPVAPPPLTPPSSSSPQTAAENVVWASLIKEQHRHLQSVFMSTSLPPPTAVTAQRCHEKPARCVDSQEGEKEEAVEGRKGATPPPLLSLPHEAELQAWSAALQGEEAARRLSAYATAMHHLATQYWDPTPASPQLEGGAGASAAPLSSPPDQPQHEGEANAAVAVSELGKKRVRDSARSGSGSVSAPAAGGSTQQGEEAPRHYSDRLRYCLWSTSSYYLGETTHEDCVRGGGIDAVASATASASASSVRGSPAFVVPVNDVSFSQLPGVMARVVKPLRRQFFQLEGRMATGREVAEMIAACSPFSSPVEGHCHAATHESVPSTPLSLLQPSIEATNWGRGPGTAWAAALQYTRHTAAAAAPPPLYVLDVGSCYGPFHGKVLERHRHPSPLTVPLRVTSMDLAPYQEDAQGADDGPADAPPSPRVWQGDWLQMQFYGSEEERRRLEAGEAEQGKLPQSATARVAEGGRVLYRQAPATTGTTPAQAAQPQRHADDGAARRSRLSAVALQVEGYDAVYFCLLLSYMPTPRLRFLACLHAFLALKEGGLLVIVSTRTQGPRRRNWMQEWADCLATVGLQRVQQSTQEKIVGMAFARVCPSAEVREALRSAEGRAAWVCAQMQSAAAEKGLRIIADDAQDRAEV